MRRASLQLQQQQEGVDERDMCFLCNAEMSETLGKRKRASGDSNVAVPPLLIVPQHSEKSRPVEAPRRAIQALCPLLPKETDGYVSLPVERELLDILVDFSRRFCNVNGRPASVDLAWRKAILPQLTESSSSNLSALFSAARMLGCSQLRQLCCKSIVAKSLRGRHAATLRSDSELAQQLAGCSDGGGQGGNNGEGALREVLETWLEEDGEAAAKVVGELAAATAQRQDDVDVWCAAARKAIARWRAQGALGLDARLDDFARAASGER